MTTKRLPGVLPTILQTTSPALYDKGEHTDHAEQGQSDQKGETRSANPCRKRKSHDSKRSRHQLQSCEASEADEKLDDCHNRSSGEYEDEGKQRADGPN